MRNSEGVTLLEMIFRSRQVPLFQFAAFYNKDLEILPGPPMVLNGRVHVNGDLYLNTHSTLEISGAITVVSDQAVYLLLELFVRDFDRWQLRPA